MGKKYIIELEDKPFHNGNGDFLYRVKGFNSLVFDMTGVGKLTPYTVPDLEQVRCAAYEEGRNSLLIEVQKAGKNTIKLEEDEYYQRGLSDAWEAARKIWKYDTTTLRAIFGEGIMRMDWFMKFTASEAIEKLKAYEQENEEQEKLKKEQSVTAEDVMRQYLDTFCKGRVCNGCPLNTPDFTCGRGYHFITSNPTSNEEVRRAYAKVLRKMKGE